jgi:transcriptional regulator with XRE-family HTH domain
MGSTKRSKPTRLAEKLLQIRESLHLSQNQMLDRLGMKDTHFRSIISSFELGSRQPSYLVLLSYAQIAGVCCDVLINDELDLPKKLPAKPKHS